jgi:hypothetical protein
VAGVAPRFGVVVVLPLKPEELPAELAHFGNEVAKPLIGIAVFEFVLRAQLSCVLLDLCDRHAPVYPAVSGVRGILLQGGERSRNGP